MLYTTAFFVTVKVEGILPFNYYSGPAGPEMVRPCSSFITPYGSTAVFTDRVPPISCPDSAFARYGLKSSQLSPLFIWEETS
jgi:hypothetical protein